MFTTADLPANMRANFTSVAPATPVQPTKSVSDARTMIGGSRVAEPA